MTPVYSKVNEFYHYISHGCIIWFPRHPDNQITDPWTAHKSQLGKLSPDEWHWLVNPILSGKSFVILLSLLSLGSQLIQVIIEMTDFLVDKCNIHLLSTLTQYMQPGNTINIMISCLEFPSEWKIRATLNAKRPLGGLHQYTAINSTYSGGGCPPQPYRYMRVPPPPQPINGSECPHPS